MDSKMSLSDYTQNLLSPNHFLSLPRPDPVNEPLIAGIPDTTTLAAHDFDVDTRTGFMPPQPPLARLPIEWQLWEELLDEAMKQQLQLGTKEGLSEEDKTRSRVWRASVIKVRMIPHSFCFRQRLTDTDYPIATGYVDR
jgi:indoleamine 2,3-dioxygenase